MNVKFVKSPYLAESPRVAYLFGIGSDDLVIVARIGPKDRIAEHDRPLTMRSWVGLVAAYDEFKVD